MPCVCKPALQMSEQQAAADPLFDKEALARKHDGDSPGGSRGRHATTCHQQGKVTSSRLQRAGGWDSRKENHCSISKGVSQGKQQYRAVQRLPPKAQAGEAVLLQLMPLTAVVVGVKHKAPLIIAFHEHHSVRGPAIWCGSGNAHSIGLRYLM